MSTLTDLYDRYGNSLRQFIKFGLIGGSGIVVNLVVVALCNNLAIHLFDSHEYDAFLRFPGTNLAIRNYIVYAIIAFLVANTYNFVLNRHWTFRHGVKAPFMKEFWPFLLVGSVAAAIGLVLLQLLMNPGSPLYLGSSFFVDGEPFWRRRVYWAQLIQVVVVMPINFIVNKLWTFRHVRDKHAASFDDIETAPDGVTQD
ncbi:MAG: GtrA family protein [Propionibacteriaceae bacterium]|jgi:putative flippase GtrA|nr:GtrA family protein [Micropruina sp.]HBX82835.1 GtrA family protein [Propionibacteriaceae bacterium]HBY23417.1 GtrA family protein [Propionibacteriaceae bacterium]